MIMSFSLTNRDDIIANSYSLITANGSVVDILDAVHGSIVGLTPSSLSSIEKLAAGISNDPNYFQTMQTSVNTKAPISTTYTTTQVDGAVGLKADLSNTYTKAEVDSLSQRIDGVEYNVFTKADNFSVGPPLLWDPAYGHQITADCYTKAEVNAILDGKPDDSELTAAVDSINTSIEKKQNKFLVAEIQANTGRLFDNNSTKFRAIKVGTPLSITSARDDYLTISCDSYTKSQTDTKISDLIGAAPALLNTLQEI